MTRTRSVARSWKSVPTIEGAGVHLKRALGFQGSSRELDPFLLLDDFHSHTPSEYLPGFPWHPHRGMETITYVLEGTVAHGDSMGNSGIIGTRDMQWMIAGSGIIHQEMPDGDADGRLWGLQLWTNLPRSHKMMAPRYRGINAEDIPEVVLDSGARVKVICGIVDGIRGPVQDIIAEPEYLDITVPPHSRFQHRVTDGHTALAYVLEGAAHFDEGSVPPSNTGSGGALNEGPLGTVHGPESVILYEREGDEVVVSTENEGTRFVLVTGQPIGEPVAWAGPIVMNTQEELDIAFQEYRDGTFVQKVHLVVEQHLRALSIVNRCVAI